MDWNYLQPVEIFLETGGLRGSVNLRRSWDVKKGSL